MTQPTATQLLRGIEAVLLYVRLGNHMEAAAVLGIHRSTYFHRIEVLRRSFGAKTITHLVWLLSPWLKDYYVIAHDEPHGNLTGKAA